MDKDYLTLDIVYNINERKVDITGDVKKDAHIGLITNFLRLQIGKGLNSTKKEIDKTVDMVLRVGELINKKLKGVQEGRCRIYPDGTSLILEKG